MGKINFSIVLGIFLAGSLSLAQETICHKYVQLKPVQEPSLQPKCRIVDTTFYFEGAVTDEMYYELRDHAPQIDRIELNSYGGLLEAAFRISELIRQRKLKTNIRKGAKCGSACTLLFQAGVERSAYPKARILYHGARLSSNWLDGWWELRQEKGREWATNYVAQQIAEVRQDSEKLFMAYLLYDMDPRFIIEYKKIDESETWFADGNFTRYKDLILTAEQLVEFNIVQFFDLREL